MLLSNQKLKEETRLTMNREGIIPCSLPLSYSHQAKSVRETSFVSEDALHALFSSGNTSSLLLDLWATGR